MAAEAHVNGIPASVPPAGRRPRMAGWAAVTVAWAIALTGGVLGVAALTDSPSPPAQSSPQPVRGLGLADRVVTSFGTISVDTVQKMVGPTGAMHIVVPPGQLPIQVYVTLNNLQRRSLVFREDWFRLVGARTAYSVGWSTKIPPLEGLSTKRVLLRFAVAPGARLPRLEFRDPAGGRKPIRVDLGETRNLVIFNPATHQHGG
jgi:hypothetical protein